MQKYKIMKCIVLCTLIYVGQITTAFAQDCFSPDAVLYGDYNATLDKTVNPFMYMWDQVQQSPVNHPRQTWMTQQGADPICPSLSVLPPDGKPTLRLASTPYLSQNQFAQGEMAIFQTIIDKNHPVIIINFAAMLETTEHRVAPGDPTGTLAQPNIAFFISVGDKEHEVSDPETLLEFYSNTKPTSWQDCVNNNGHRAIYRDWTTVAFDMTNNIGKQVNVYAVAKDCAGLDKYDLYPTYLDIELCQKRHLAILYCNVDCAESITLDYQDCEKGTSTMHMPEGYYSYKWFYEDTPDQILGTTREVTFSTRQTGANVCCEVVLYTSKVNEPLKTLTKKFFLTNNCMHCADHDNITYSVSPDLGEVETYSVLFDDAAKAQGFVDITDATPSSPNMVSVAMPKHENSYVRPDNYSAQIILQIAGQTKKDTLSWDFNILYPSSVIGQDWNDVLYIKNKDFNGGFNFSQIKWFRNEEPVEAQGEHNGYMVNPYSFNGNDVFVAELTRTDDGKTIRTCPCQPTAGNPDEIDFGVQVYTAPGRLHISSANISGEFRVYGLCGNLFANGQFGPKTNATELDVQVTWPMGVYVLQLNREDGKTENKKMLIF